jgi:hypothetical protein
MILSMIRNMIAEDDGPYYVAEYDSLTDIYIDTILYSPKRDKLATFVITRNSDDKLLTKGPSDKYHFNAHCFLGKRDTATLSWSIKWFRRMNFIQHETYGCISEKIRYRYFNNLADLKDSDGNSQYRYNLDDLRFWDGPAWEINTSNSPAIFENGNKN